jgi:DNA-directed RNA polymerase specialized sigma24 family protein
MNYTYNPANVEENYTEVLVNFYRRIATYNSERPITTWLHIVTKRQIAEIERKRKTHRDQEDGRDIETFVDHVFSNGDPSSNTMNVENYREFYSDDVVTVLDQMKSLHRDALLLQEAGYSLKEIAEIEFNKGTLKSRNIETVKSRLFLARQFLKNYLTRDGKRKSD